MPKQVHPGADLPLAVAGRGAARRDGPVGIKAAEVVDAEQVVNAQSMADPLHPPGVSCLFMVRPVIQRVAPQLAIRREIIRRAAGHPGKAALAVQLKQGAAHPGVHRVRRDVNGDIAQDLHALCIGVVLDGFPLGVELVLQELPEADLFLMGGAEPGQRSGIPRPVLPGPVGPALHLVFGLEGHVQGVILQPGLVGQRKGIIIIRIIKRAAVLARALLPPSLISSAEHFVAAGVEGAVVHFQRVFAPLFCLELGRGEQALGLEGVEVDEIGVARKGGAALVGAVAVAGGAQGQDLPDGLACLGQKIHKLQRRFAKAADPIGAGQAGHRHQNSTFTHDVFPSSFGFVRFYASSYHNITADYFPQAKIVVYL